MAKPQEPNWTGLVSVHDDATRIENGFWDSAAAALYGIWRVPLFQTVAACRATNTITLISRGAR